MNWHAYERRKAAWIAAHPRATPEEYEQAARGEFRAGRRVPQQAASPSRLVFEVKPIRGAR